MHVSVTALGTDASQAGRAARNIVEYLSGQGQQPGARVQAPLAQLQDDAKPGGYYADSAELPGRWIGSGVDELISAEHRSQVEPQMLERLLLGQHPETGEQLVSSRGSALRAGRGTPDLQTTAPSDPDRLMTVREVASLVGVDDSYIQRLLRRTDQVLTAAANDPSVALPDTYLRGTKVDRQWFITHGEAHRFMEGRAQPRVVLGYDLTFSVAKSVSVAWAASDQEGRQIIEQALHQAVDRSLNYVEANGVKVRVNRTQADGEGMIAAAFLHDTSRELEPQLHIHVVVANMGRTKGGQIQALDGRGLFAHGTTAGYLAESEIQSILAEQGYRFTKTEKGIAHLEHIPQATVDALSTRRTQILEEVGALGVNSPAARQNAAYSTRAAKVDGVDRADLERRWHDTMVDTGMTPEQLTLATSSPGFLLWTPADTERLDRFLASADGVTRSTGIFDRRDVIQTITDHVGGRLNADEVQSHADRWLATDAVIPLRPRQAPVGDDFIGRAGRVALAPGTIYYTTPQVVATELAITEGYENGRNRGSAVARTEVVDQAIARWQTSSGHELGQDQIAMVRSITTSGHQFQPVVGPAGSGKTAALEVAARAWESDGYTVIGASVNGNATEVLAKATGIETRTVASLLERLRYDAGLEPGRTDGLRPLLSPQSVVLIDEASTLSNREHAELLRRVADHGATLRTVGDPAQHSSVEAGGGWAAVVEAHADITPALTENRRMKGPEMEDVRLAAKEYREGHIERALRRLERGDRMITAPTSAELLDMIAVDWSVDWQRHLASPEDVLPSRMTAENHAIRRELNERAQVLLRADGLIDPDGVRIGESTFHVGDQVIARQQDRQLRPPGGDRQAFVKNGTKGVVVAIEDGAGPAPSLIVDFDRRGPIPVPNEFLTKPLRPGVRGGLAPAYAMTTHAAQGDTYDASPSVVTDRSSTAGVYVALTRGSNDVRMYALDVEEFGPPSPAAEHNLPISSKQTTLEHRIEARLTRPQPTDLATKADPDLARLSEYSSVPVRSLEQLEDPVAQRVARVKLSQAQRRMIRELPSDLGAVIGDTSDSAAWRSAVTRFSNYQERWGENPLLGPPTAEASQRQHRDHEDVELAIARARGERLGQLTPTEISQARAALPSNGPRSESDRRTVAGIEQRLTERRELEASAVSGAHHRHRAALEPVGGRIVPDEVERYRRLAERAQRDLDRTEASIRDLQALRGRTPSSPTANVRVRIERQALSRLADGHARQAVAQPQTYLTNLLGPRPKAKTAGREQWREAALSVERYRVLHLGLGPIDGPAARSGSALHRAIGPRPTGGSSRATWDVLRNVIARVHSPAVTVPGPTIGRS